MDVDENPAYPKKLGGKLRVGADEYSDLDEFCVRCVGLRTAIVWVFARARACISAFVRVYACGVCVVARMVAV